jgi:hypothetical protein
MQKQTNPMRATLASVVLIYQLILLGCSADIQQPSFTMDDFRQAEKAKERQNERVAEMEKTVIASSAELVKADAAARNDWIATQSQIEQTRSDLTAQQNSILAEYDELEVERKAIANQRLTQSVLAAVFKEFGPVLVCCLPFVLLLILMLRSDRTFRSDPIPEVLIEQLEIAQMNHLDEPVEHSVDSIPLIPISLPAASKGDQS